MTSAALVESLRVSGRLNDLIAQAAVEGIGGMCGVDGSFVAEIPMPWSEPPSVIAIMSMTEISTNTRALAWIGGDFDALASIAEMLLGERPVDEDEMFEDCVRELANITSGRLQECLGDEGISMALGLPIYISGAKRLHVGATLVKGAAVTIAFDMEGQPLIQAGYATEESR
jgi:CheY-specific phosphatase CheX